MNMDRQLRFWAIALVIAFALLWLLQGVLGPFLVGLALAYMLDPLADRLERRGAGRTLSTGIVMGGFALIFALILLLVLPRLVHQGLEFARALPDMIDRLAAWLQPWLDQLASVWPGAGEGQIKTALEGHMPALGQLAQRVTAGAAATGARLLDVIAFIFVTPVVAFYLLRDWDRLVAQIDGLLPRDHAPVIRELSARIGDRLAGFVRGQATVCLILGLFYGFALTVAGLNFGLFIGLGAGFLSFIPYVGSLVGFGVSVGMALAQSDSYVLALVVAGIFLFGQAIEGNVLTPRLVGEKVGLHAVWVIFALMAGGSLFGFAGVMVAVPLAASIGVLVRHGIERYRDSAYYHGAQPRPAPEPAPAEPALPPPPVDMGEDEPGDGG